MAESGKREKKKVFPAATVPRGAVVNKRDGRAEVVRYVSTVLHFADGTQEVYDPSEEIELLPPDQATPAGEELEALQHAAASAAQGALLDRERVGK